MHAPQKTRQELPGTLNITKKWNLESENYEVMFKGKQILLWIRNIPKNLCWIIFEVTFCDLLTLKSGAWGQTGHKVWRNQGSFDRKVLWDISCQLHVVCNQTLTSVDFPYQTLDGKNHPMYITSILIRWTVINIHHPRNKNRQNKLSEKDIRIAAAHECVRALRQG